MELAFHDIEKTYPRVCRGALLLSRWGCDPMLLRVIEMLHGAPFCVSSLAGAGFEPNIVFGIRINDLHS